MGPRTLLQLKSDVYSHKGQREDALVQDEALVDALGTVFLQKLETDDVDLVIHALIGFEGSIDAGELRQLVVDKLLPLPQFSSKLVERPDKIGAFSYKFVDVDLKYHVQEVDLTSYVPSEKSNPAMEYADSIMLRPLDYDRPLWEIVVVRHAKRGACESSLLFRCHHCLGDGTAFASLFLDLVTTRNGQRPTLPKPRPAPKTTLWGLLWLYLVILWNTLGAYVRMHLNIFLPADPVIGIKVGTSVRHLPSKVQGLTLRLEDLKEVARTCNATVNDVILAAAAAAMDKYNRREIVCGESAAVDNEAVEAVQVAGQNSLRASNFSLPPCKELQEKPSQESPPTAKNVLIVNLRPPMSGSEIEEMRWGRAPHAKWGTIVGYLTHPLPVVARRPLDRVKEVNRTINRSKRSLEAQLSNAVLHLLHRALGPKYLLKFLTNSVLKVSVAISNMAGPEQDVFFLGRPVVSMLQWVTGSPQGLSIHVMSIAGQVFLTINYHPTHVHGEIFRDCYEYAFLELQEEARGIFV